MSGLNARIFVSVAEMSERSRGIVSLMTIFMPNLDASPTTEVLIEESNLGSQGAEIAEIWFPPGYQGSPHPHELEIIYVLEGELDHIVNDESHILKPGMIGVVRARDRVVHRTHSPEGVRTLVVWPLGNEVGPMSQEGMREKSL